MTGNNKFSNKTGQIQLIIGPMFSGKTSELIKLVKRYRIAHFLCMIVRYAHDTRYSTSGISTHDRQTLPAVTALQLTPLVQDMGKYDVIGIDEGQFFPDIVEFCENMANAGKIVLVAALDGTYQRQGFCNILKLIPLAENVVKLTAVCMICCNDAPFTMRLGVEKEVEVIGGAEKYMPVCRECYNNQSKLVVSNN